MNLKQPRTHSLTIESLVGGTMCALVRCRFTPGDPVEVLPIGDGPEAKSLAEHLRHDGVTNPVDGKVYRPKDGFSFLLSLNNRYNMFSRYSASWDPDEPR